METTVFHDIRVEQIFGTSTIGFRNMQIPIYLAETSLISLAGTAIALFMLSMGFDYITQRDVEWAIATWAIGTFSNLPLLLWLRSSRKVVCQYCQKAPPASYSKFCKTCNEEYALQDAHDKAKEVIMDRIRLNDSNRRAKGV